MISRLCALHRDNTKERAHHLMIHILYNPLAGSGRSEEKARAVIAYDDIASINYFGDLCKAWYRRGGAQVTDAIAAAQSFYGK